MNNDSKTLVILSPGFPKDEADTTCLPSQQIFIRSLNKNFPSLKIIILSLQYPFSTITYRWYGNQVIPFNGMKKGLMARLRLWRMLWRTLQSIRKENNLAGMFSFWCSESALIGKYFGRRHHLKHFAWITGQDAKKGNKYISLIRPRPRELIAMSDFLSNEFYKNYGVRPAHIIPNAIAPSLFPPQYRKRDLTILGVGSLIALKQYEIFVNAASEIIKEIPTAKAVLCGKGPMEPELLELIRSQRLQDAILLTGEKPHPEILQLMQHASIFLHTSNYEGFSTVCLEALYAGCHVISFIKPMGHDIDHWHIVHTKEEMVKKAIALLTDPGTAYTAVLPYTMDDTAGAVMQLFNYRDIATS